MSTKKKKTETPPSASPKIEPRPQPQVRQDGQDDDLFHFDPEALARM